MFLTQCVLRIQSGADSNILSNHMKGEINMSSKKKICVSTFSFSNALYTDKIPTMEDFFRIVKELGLDGVELVSMNILDRDPDAESPFGAPDPDRSPEPVFPDGTRASGTVSRPAPDTNTIKIFQKHREKMAEAARKRPQLIDNIKIWLKKYDLRVGNMPIDFGDIGNPDKEARRSDIEMLKFWIDIAAELGSPSVRFNSGHVNRDADGNLDLSICIESYRELADYGATKNVAVTMENHGGATEFPEAVVAIFKGVNHPNFQLTPDVGNFHLGEDMYRGIDMMFSCGKPMISHIKTYAFGDEYGEGCDSHTDFRRMGEIAKKHGFDGWYSIETNGACGKDFVNIIKTKEIIEKYF